MEIKCLPKMHFWPLGTENGPCACGARSSLIPKDAAVRLAAPPDLVALVQKIQRIVAEEAAQGMHWSSRQQDLFDALLAWTPAPPVAETPLPTLVMRDGVSIPATVAELLVDADRFAVQSDVASWYVGRLAEVVRRLLPRETPPGGGR